MNKDLIKKFIDKRYRINFVVEVEGQVGTVNTRIALPHPINTNVITTTLFSVASFIHDSGVLNTAKEEALQEIIGLHPHLFEVAEKPAKAQAKPKTAFEIKQEIIEEAELEAIAGKEETEEEEKPKKGKKKGGLGKLKKAKKAKVEEEETVEEEEELSVNFHELAEEDDSEEEDSSEDDIEALLAEFENMDED